MKLRNLLKGNGFFRPFLLRIALAYIVIVGVGYSVSAENLTLSDVRASIEEARSAGVDVFSPGHFDKAIKAFNKAAQDSSEGKNPEGILRRLEEARMYLTKAEQTTVQMRESFPDLITAYENALRAGSPERAASAYMEAMNVLEKISEKLEKGDLRSATETTGTAIRRFRDAELQAIKAAVLNGAREKLKRLTEMDGEELTPRLYAQALENLRDAERLIDADRYDTERPRRLVDEAQYIMDHALFLTGWIKLLREDPGGWETLIVQFETYLQEISSILYLHPKFDRDMALSVEPIAAAVRSLQVDRDHLQAELARRDQRIGELEAEVGRLRDQSGKYVSELETRRQQVLEQQRYEEKIARITSLLVPEEGSVVRSTSGQSEFIILRLTGMKFPSGSAEIQAQDFGLLTKVQQILREFPDRAIEIHGHTDSKGREEDNQKLSKARAEAVREYLLRNLAISETQIKAIGFGESQPISSNETVSGRNQNRRIEIVLIL